MRVTVLVHESDEHALAGLAFGADRGLSETLFPEEPHAFELAVYSPHGIAHLTTSTGTPTTVNQLAREGRALLLLAGDHALACQNLVEVLLEYVGGEPAHSWSNPALVVVRCSEKSLDILDCLPSECVFHVPEAANLAAIDKSRTGGLDASRYAREIQTALDAIEENQTQNPNVGFGLLLMNPDGRFYLQERLRQPGRHKIGSIGGSFMRGESVRTTLDAVLKKRFRHSQVPEIQLGPLLACTNMRDSFYHYVDLTFLATTNRNVALRGNLDPGLRPIPLDRLDSLTDVEPKARKREQRVWFSVAEVARMQANDMLFTPVANAFEAFCRRALSYEAKNGLHKTLRVPSLFDSAILDIPWSPPPGGMLGLMSGLDGWSPIALPFFEKDEI